MNIELLLIRHATPDWSRTDLRYDIPPGPPLTEHGRAEAEAAAEYLRQATNVGKILVSPLDRAKETAEVIGARLGIPATIDSAVAEWQRGESEDDVTQRMSQMCESAAKSGANGSVVVVSHGGPIRTLLEFLGVSKEEIGFYCRQFDRNNPAPPAGIWRAWQAGPDARWQVELVYTPVKHQKYAPDPTTETATVYL